MKTALLLLAAAFAAPQVATFVNCCCTFCTQEGGMEMPSADTGGC